MTGISAGDSPLSVRESITVARRTWKVGRELSSLLWENHQKLFTLLRFYTVLYSGNFGRYESLVSFFLLLLTNDFFFFLKKPLLFLHSSRSHAHFRWTWSAFHHAHVISSRIPESWWAISRNLLLLFGFFYCFCNRRVPSRARPCKIEQETQTTRHESSYIGPLSSCHAFGMRGTAGCPLPPNKLYSRDYRSLSLSSCSSHKPPLSNSFTSLPQVKLPSCRHLCWNSTIKNNIFERKNKASSAL